MEKRIAEIYEKIIRKERKVAGRNAHKIPYTAKDGVFDDRGAADICWWTNGFWGGMMWQLYHATKDPLYREIAVECERKLDENLMNHCGLDHDNGFKWLPTAVAHYHVCGDAAARNRALLAADNLAGRFNPAGRYLRAWNDWDGNETGSFAGRAIIDCMMNLPLLYWAAEELRDPRYFHIAAAHADTAMTYFVREDGSVRHIVDFDAMTGKFIRDDGGQGYGGGSSWTRGQAWAVYGFALSFRHTRNDKYLQTSRKVADYFTAHIPKSGLIPIDFRQPDCPAWEDSSAAAVAACGMLELSSHLPDGAGKKYADTAKLLLRTLAERRCDFSPDTDNLLEKCSAAYHDREHEFPIIYGDYYFIEAVWKLCGKELFIW